MWKIWNLVTIHTYSTFMESSSNYVIFRLCRYLPKGHFAPHF
ncbi:hypothetical protein KUTeg_013021, partial [Tegillarca granosa]